jgi:hypothetical protein
MALTFKSAVQNSKFLASFLKPVSNAYANVAGYRQIGKLGIGQNMGFTLMLNLDVMEGFLLLESESMRTSY